MKHVTVIGGGFSGLVTAYYLARDGVHVTLLEKQNRLGGLLGTQKTEHGFVELAASGIRPTARVEALCEELGVPLIESNGESRKRYIFRDEPRRWPLGPLESLELGGRLAGSVVTGRFRPDEAETIERWSSRVLGSPAARFLVGAALQGIYAGDPAKLSAPLIFGRKKRKPAKGKLKTLVAPPEGMAQLVDALGNRLVELGADVRLGATAIDDIDGTVIVCTSANDAPAVIRRRAPRIADVLGQIEMLPLVRVTAFYPPEENTIGGFGVLFPREQRVRALGVLFNTNIFAGRGPAHSESWILGGAQDRGVMDLDDEALFEQIAMDRTRVYGREAEPIAMFAQRWPLALPHYDTRLETLLRSGLETPRDLFLAGNYLHGIGLPMLVENAWEIRGQVCNS